MHICILIKLIRDIYCFLRIMFFYTYARTYITSILSILKCIEKLEDLILLIVEKNVVIITQLICLAANHGKKSREIAKMSTNQCCFVCFFLCDISICRQYARGDAQLHHDNLCKPTITWITWIDIENEHFIRFHRLFIEFVKFSIMEKSDEEVLFNGCNKIFFLT